MAAAEHKFEVGLALREVLLKDGEVERDGHDLAGGGGDEKGVGKGLEDGAI